MKLYYSPGACSLAPHIVLREAGAEAEIVKVDLARKQTETGADFLAINPKGYVPALELDDGSVLTEGMIIQQYLADRFPEARLAPARGTQERLRMEEMLTFISSELHKTYSPLFVATMPDDAKSAFREKLAKRYAVIETLLSDERPYLGGEDFSVADAYLHVIAGWSRGTGIDLSRWPHLSAFQERMASRPAVQAARQAEGLPAA